ncbi:Golgin subfamily A [Trichuris trichiura]|uniref:Ras modification protein ERF4 n=1 Tax=Trichuris trichiura TaxID=36087 RepID=A0A077YVY4_TRITR|nr:Golgin subfamily A [Trichuris trichiura]
MGDVAQRNISVALDDCRKIFVRRDYSAGMVVKFSTKLPPELQGRLDPDEFARIITKLNEIYAKAEKITCESVFENVIGFFSCYLAHLCITFQYDKYLRFVSNYLKEQNEKVFIPHGLFVVDPIERGLRVVSFKKLPTLFCFL